MTARPAGAAREPLFARLARASRTTAVRLSILHLVVFSIFSFFLVVVVSHDAARIMTLQLHEAIDVDVAALEDQYRLGGLVRLFYALDERGRRPDAGLYYVVDTSGNPIAGNVAELPPSAFDDTDDEARPVDYVRFEAGKAIQHVALVRSFALDNGFRVLVGRDLGERDRFRVVVRRAFRAMVLMLVVLGGVTWLFLSRRVLRRIDQVSETSGRIVAGDLSGRLPVTGAGDEFDRLAVALNGMLAKIVDLMKGLKDVSDNVAHDLKTPLTRLRNRVEGALSGPPDLERWREALEATIEESDALIRTFDALLMITRVEAGSALTTPEPVDLAALVREIAELYEPVAEDAGTSLTVKAEPATVSGNRELLALAVTNLVDNALKYGHPGDRPATITLAVTTGPAGAALSVADDGPGIPEADRERVLGRFVRLEASRNAPGSGLGLSLVAAVAQQHRATLTLEEATPGLRVVLRFPAP
ncbi:HAMP domain-containing protein [Siculibacillus lacustris]|uniref:histidine kinase n=1 Tax=Siculibacillus lacustris TaxID=1549641 RepID=A0A4Q9VX51_9HYPH|nr:ATP-binding protein [Siculibacillus lacustris]TBW40963.1 HAMP domain-containing protein [Siculibacillus lacustris]